jgi:hypothetical protein
MGYSAQQYVRIEFAWDGIVEKYVALYGELLAETQG